MSTKTTFKRVALVAVAALSFGVLSTVPSQAADNAILKYAAGDGAAASPYNTGNGVAGVANSVTLSYTRSSTGKGAYVTISGASSTVRSASNGSIVTGAAAIIYGSDTASSTIVLNTPAEGAITASVFLETSVGSGLYSTTAAETVVITVGKVAQSGAFNAANSTVFLASGETITAATADASVTAAATAVTDTAVATIQVVLKDALKAAYSDTVTATIVSGPGNVFAATDTTTVGVAGGTFKAAAGTVSDKALAPAAASATVQAGTVFFGIFANGQSGVSTIRLTLSDGTVLGSKTVTFSSTTAATITAAVKKAYVVAGGDSTKNTKAFAVTVKDAAGFDVTSGTVTATPATTATAATAAQTCSYDTTDKVFYCAAVGADSTKFGPVEYTFTHSSVASTVAKAVATTTFSDIVAAKIAVSAPATASAGDYVTYTLTMTDKNGYPVADTTYNTGLTVGGSVFASVVYSAANWSPFAAADTITTVSGVATSKVYLPVASGKVEATWTLAGTAGTASGALAKELTATKLVATTTISNPGLDAATDAANEATDAANAATDAANAAAEAADAATAAAQDASDAVAALSTKVDELIGALKKQITTLTNLVIKIQKKVKA